MKKISIIIKYMTILSIIIILVGCEDKGVEEKDEIVSENTMTEKNKEEEQNDMNLTIEYVCSEFGIDESEFEGVDFEEFIEYYGLSYETIHNEAIKFLLRRYKEEYGNIQMPDYEEMFGDVGSENLTCEKDIAVFLFEEYLEDATEIYIFDFEIMKLVFGTGSLSDVTTDEIIGVVDEKHTQKLVELINEYEIDTWVVEKPSLKENVVIEDGCASWKIYIKYSDGTIYKLSGEHISDKDSPIELNSFVEDLKALVESVPEEQ